ncbi:MAG: replicative DNA helicase [Eubacterium sp.]|nr:replicative DNA helicase [Eubacterium sp.]
MNEQVIKRILPHDGEAEQSVIGSILLNHDAIYTASERLTPGDFYNPQFKIIYEAMLALYTANSPIDVVTLKSNLESKGAPEELTSVEFLSNIVQSVPTSANIKYYCDIVRNKAVLRRLIDVSEKITNTCYEDQKELNEILESAEREIFQVSQNNNNTEFMPIRKVALDALKNIYDASQTSGSVTGVSTGFYDLDRKTAGLQPSNLVLIAARPAMGKTAFALNIAEYVGMKNKITTAIFSLEMSKLELAKRLMSMNSKVDSQHIRSGNLTDEEWNDLSESTLVLGESKIVIDDTPAISIQELRSKCRKLKLEQDLGLVIIDYLQLMNGSSGRKSESRQNEISEISRNLKAIAREIDCPVIALSQLSRAVEGRDDKRPMLSDLRESGAIEQDADVVMFLYRDEYYNKDSDRKGITEVIIGKQRSGPTGTVELKWLAEYTKFANLDVGYRE